MSSINRDQPPPYDFTDNQYSMEDESRLLPRGWVREYDHANKHHFYVDTTASPPRSIWDHPFEDEQFRREHPELFKRPEGGRLPGPRSSSAAGPSTGRGNQPEKKGFMQKLKEKAAEHAAKREEERRQRERLQREAIQRYVMHRQRLEQGYPRQPMYASGPPNAYDYNQYRPPPGYAGRRMGGGGMALPLVGGLAGGMLLGSMLDNDSNYDGDFGDMGGFDF